MYRVLPLPALTALATLIMLPLSLQAGRVLPAAEIAGAQAAAHAAVTGAASSEAAPHGAREVKRASDGLFYVTAKVNGAPVRFLVDTGATVVVLSAADAQRTGLADNARYDAKIATAGGHTPMAWTTIDMVEVAGQQVRGLRAAVVRQELGVSLLGQNALARLGPVTIEGDRLRVG